MTMCKVRCGLTLLYSGQLLQHLCHINLNSATPLTIYSPVMGTEMPISGPQCMYLIYAVQNNEVGSSSLYKCCKRSKETPGARL